MSAGELREDQQARNLSDYSAERLINRSGIGCVFDRVFLLQLLYGSLFTSRNYGRQIKGDTVRPMDDSQSFEPAFLMPRYHDEELRAFVLRRSTSAPGAIR